MGPYIEGTVVLFQFLLPAVSFLAICFALVKLYVQRNIQRGKQRIIEEYRAASAAHNSIFNPAAENEFPANYDPDATTKIRASFWDTSHGAHFEPSHRLKADTNFQQSPDSASSVVVHVAPAEAPK